MTSRILCVLGALLFVVIVKAGDNQRVNWQHLQNRFQPSYRGGRRTNNVHGGGRRIRRMGRLLMGPNVCGSETGQKYCCPGWTVSRSRGTKCDQPMCSPGQCAPNGICSRPKLCICEDGLLKTSCSSGKFNDDTCNIRCMNGGTCMGSTCLCADGYTGAYCGQPICGPGCLNGGRCINPNKCACTYGFTGDRCERDYRIGPCFLTRANETCTDQLEDIMCSKRLCCATVGQGWGRPCEECPARVGNCTKGRLPPLCTDIDECQSIPGLCKDGTCVNTDGSFRCECSEGYRHDTRLHQCVDIDECEEGFCENGKCTNTKGSFMCECDSDYILSQDGSYCIMDIPGHCYTSVESGMCSNPLENLVKRAECCCPIINEMTLGKCFAIPGYKTERCPTAGTDDYIKNCADRIKGGNDMCNLLGKMACEHGECVASGTDDYHCICDTGFIPTPDHKTCSDINECAESGDPRNDICGPDGTCMNTIGSFTCHCDNGFKVSEDNTCTDVDECVDHANVCENGECVNTKGSFICRCGDGYRTTATQQGCEDYDECSEDLKLCEDGRCINTEGGYRCICNPGFVASQDLKSCGDEDECGTSGICGNGECVNRDGSFECNCLDGYKLTADGKQCKDDDECLVNPCVNGECVNTEGSFQCNCHRFQVLDETGRKCVLDQTLGTCFREVRNGECAAINSLADMVSRSKCCCFMPGGSSAWGESCEPCPEIGSEDHGVLCPEDAQYGNVCALMRNPCENGKCINEAGNTFSCDCDDGYEQTSDGKACNDIDNCASSDVCSNGLCRNTPGSYQCICDEGFVLNGDICENIQECISNPCINGKCVDKPGTFVCECEPGWQIGNDGLECHDVREQTCWRTFVNETCMDDIQTRVMTVEECCNSVGEAWGSVDCRPCSDFPLRCPKGYFYNVAADKCVDINECEIEGCKEDAICRNTIGSYICECEPPLTLDVNGIDCVDLRIEMCYFDYEESTNTCSRPTGKLQRRQDCCCTVGRGWGEMCEGCPVKGSEDFQDLCKDIIYMTNECLDHPNLCENGKCQNTDDGYVCICNAGYTLDETGTVCYDIPECEISPGICGNGECVNIDGGFKCICEEGYILSPSGDTCINHDECMEGGRCTGGTCLDTEGSYECVCPDGRSLADDGTHCVDVDECSVLKDLCEPNGECINMLGYFICVCDIGFEPTTDQTSCIDVDECAVNNGECTGICTNNIGSFECSCDAGFSLSYDGYTCADDDECMEQANRCDGGRCQNMDGTFRCVCFDGFMAEADLQYCEDIDECAISENICLNGKCHNTRGSYTCNCDPGYCVPQGQMICVDEDECKLGKHTCDVNADCSNTDGGFECTCIEGFDGDGFDCEDLDECADGSHNCDANADCVNTHGAFNCECTDGWHGDGFSCSDVEDCLEDENLCGPYGTCLNVDGSFTCDCPMGFMNTEDQKACKDIDECTIEHICVNGRCSNVPGTFKCECVDGFQKDDQGANCTDVDECEEVANCMNGECVNSIGSYECQCPDGFQSNPSGVGCVDVRVGDCYWNVIEDDLAPVCETEIGIKVSRSACCCSYGEGWGNPCEICPDMNTTEYNVLCPGGPGFKPNPITVLLEDIDECLELPGLCQGGKCVNTFGSFRCDCKEGYALNEENRVCEDVDECLEVSDICGPGNCTNKVGGYNCWCPDGYISYNQGRECKDIRESFCYRNFDANTNECSSPMYFNVTNYECCCLKNMGQGWNIPCEICPTPQTDDFRRLCNSDDLIADPDVCDNIEGLCLNGVCLPAEDGYRCECSMGYRFNEEQLICEDIDECAGENRCQENAVCVNLPGLYRCNCIDGYEFDDDATLCLDLDECADEDFCTNGQCENNAGGYECLNCEQGYRLNDDATACEDIPECEVDICGHGTCTNLIGSFACDCDDGYEVGANGDCIDINECDEGSICKNGFCENLDGSYECICDEGYNQSADGGKSCVDANECKEDENVCGAGTCNNMEGSYQCYCPTGYSNPDGLSCVDDDECDLKNMCAYGSCTNTPGSFYCTCPTGFSLSANKEFCIDQRRGLCYADFTSDGQCESPRPDSVIKSSCCCRCMEAAWGEEGGTCEECPIEGSEEFSVMCPHGCGATPDGGDINECTTNNPCKNGKCVNMAKGYKCICPVHYELADDGNTCIDIDECASNVCGQGTCTNTDGGFNCVCHNGYYNGPDSSCIDVNECAHDAHGCAFRCENTDGGFECTCPSGYTLQANQRTCEDVNECEAENLNTCTQKGMVCSNKIGYYLCLCPAGYRRIGVSDECVDIDECESSNVCQFGICDNIEGSFKCRCDEGYEYDEDGKRCIDNRQGYCYSAVHQRMCELTATTGQLTTKSQCCCNTGRGWGPECELCPRPGTPDFVQLCPHGPGFDSEGNDIDDCVVTPNLCSNGTCVNVLGSYKCVCNRGFMSTPSMQACVDIDECVGNHGCSGGSRCFNEQGGYTCKCPPGYQITNTKRCVDIDECHTKVHNCHFLCHNTIGSYKCGCPAGFRLNMEDKSCVDIDECADDPEICGANALCKNDDGAYHCVCKPGFEKNYNGDACVGLPCDANPDVCGEDMCLNVGNSFRCVPGCSNGFNRDFMSLRCIDLRDCRRNPCTGYNQQCMPSGNFFRCSCRNGFSPNPRDNSCGDVNECRFQNSPCSFGCNNKFGGYSCGCPQNFYGIGGGHCLGGYQGFQQPMRPQFPQQFGQRGGYGQQRGGYGGNKCFSCPPMRYKRSLDSQIVEASQDEEVNASLPVILHVSNKDLTPKLQLLKLLPALNPLKNGNVKYRISKGNDDNMFRMHTKDETHFLHLNRNYNREHVSGRRITVEATPTVDEATIIRNSLNNKVMQNAMKAILEFDVEIDVTD